MAKKVTKKSPPKKNPETFKNNKIREIKVKVVGIGGGANSIVADIASRMKGVDFVAANTDSQSLKAFGKRVKSFQFGEELTGGMGTGMDFELGQRAAQKEEKRIKELLKGQDFCIFVSCLGGGTGSGATPVFAKTSKDLGNINFGIFTLPFKFEGEKKAEIARETLMRAKPYFKAFSVIPNERIFKIVDEKTPLKEALSAINQRLTESLTGLIEMIKTPGLINVDFADLRTILSQKKRLAFLNKIEIGKETKEEIAELISSPLYPYSIKGAGGLLFNIVGSAGLGIGEVSRVSRGIQKLAGRRAKIIFGVTHKKSLGNKFAVTLLATGCESREGVFNDVVKRKKSKPKDSSEKTKPLTKKEKPKSEAKKPVKKAKKIKVGSRSSSEKSINEEEIKKEVLAKKIVSSIENEIPMIEAEEDSELKELISEMKESPSVTEKVRRNALQIRKELEKEERERMEKEKVWEIPALLRRKNQKVDRKSVV